MEDYNRDFKDYSAMMWLEEFNKGIKIENFEEYEQFIKLLNEAFRHEQGKVALLAYKLKYFTKELWESLSASDKSFILAFKPQLAKDFNEWGKLYDFNWQFLLERQPQFIKEAEKHISGWAGILSIKPEWFNKTITWQKFSKDDWFILLQSQPQFIKHCPYIDKFNKFEKRRLLRKHPNLSKIILNYNDKDV